MKSFFTILCASCMLLSFSRAAGRTLRVLFLGNSYTYYNNMPNIVADIALSMGDTLLFDSNAPGGQTLQGHSADALSVNKIKAGGWDFVVLQEQSQLPSFQYTQVQTNVLPYARLLDSLVDKYNTCGQTMFYMTWGRKNGDAGNCPTWPYVCTYQGMDSLLRERYLLMAQNGKAEISPAGPVWRYIRQQHAGIELYDADESHPSKAGSYAAACSFYTALFRKDVSKSSYNYTLNAADAAAIRAAAKKVVYDSAAKWYLDKYKTTASFTHLKDTGIKVSFTNTSANATSYSWSFGDGNSATLKDPVHKYTAKGTYTVRMIAAGSTCNDTFYTNIAVYPTGIREVKEMQPVFKISPNPADDFILLQPEDNMPDHYDVTLYNNIGQKVYHAAEAQAKTLRIDVSHLPQGSYILKIHQGARLLATEQVIKR